MRSCAPAVWNPSASRASFSCRVRSSAWPGTALGTLLGIGLALNVETIVPWLETTFNFRIMPGDVYYVTEIPAEIHTTDIVLIPILALLVAVLATVYPSRRAAAVAPAQALRYE